MKRDRDTSELMATIRLLHKRVEEAKEGYTVLTEQKEEAVELLCTWHEGRKVGFHAGARV